MTAPEVHLRPADPADPADAEGAGAMHFASFVETYSELAAPDFWNRATHERSIENWRRMLDAGNPAMLAEVDDVIVGLAMVSAAVTRDEIDPVRHRELTNLYVLAQHQGRGIGQALLEAVLPAGAPAQLWVAQGNPPAVRFYERHGFVADGATVVGSGFGGIAALRMAR